MDADTDWATLFERANEHGTTVEAIRNALAERRRHD
jgi:hypothetical protein